jgi:hypothetical protein
MDWDRWGAGAEKGKAEKPEWGGEKKEGEKPEEESEEIT